MYVFSFAIDVDGKSYAKCQWLPFKNDNIAHPSNSHSALLYFCFFSSYKHKIPHDSVLFFHIDTVPLKARLKGSVSGYCLVCLIFIKLK